MIMEGIANEMVADAWSRAIGFVTGSLLPTWAAFIVIGTLAELVFPAERGQSPAGRLLNARYSIVYAAFIFACGPAVIIFINAIGQAAGTGWIDLSQGFGNSMPAQIAASFLIYLITDFYYYWLHRIQHTVPWLWDQHAVHHSDPELNVTTSVRHHWLEYLLQSVAIAVPMTVLFKLPAVTTWAISMTFAGWSFFIHSNLRIELGPLSWLLCGPQVHRLHHSRLAEHADKNFAAYFPVWDVVFGTWCPPRRGEFPPTGLHSGEHMRSAWLLSIWPLKKWVGRVKVGMRDEPAKS